MPVKISPSILHRLDACLPARNQWGELFGHGETEVKEAVAQVAITKHLGLAWFLEKTCGARTILAIERAYTAAVEADWREGLPDVTHEADRLAMSAAVDMGAVNADVWHMRYQMDGGWRAAAFMARAGLNLAKVRKHEKMAGTALYRIESTHWAAHALTWAGKRPIPNGARMARVLAEEINRHSRVINRSLALAGVK